MKDQVMTQQLTIGGMTCANCVRHVTEALREIPGVRNAQVDLDTGSARIEADREIPRTELVAALDEAGYTLT